MKIGKYEIKAIEAGKLKLDGGSMFGIIPKPLWSKTNPPDEANRIDLSTRCLLLQSESRNILIDTGMGSKWDDKSRKIYAIDQTVSSLETSLKNIGLKKSDITDVILTHLHFDHAGGATSLENGKIVPAFANAKFYVQKKNFDWGSNPSERDKGSYVKENFIPLMEAGVLNFIEGEEDFDDEIKFLVVNGHTFGQQLVKISDDNDTLLYCADLLPFTSHLHLPFVMGFDLQPLETVKEKKRILPVAIEENWKLFFEHDPETVYATVKNTERGFTAKEKFSSL